MQHSKTIQKKLYDFIKLMPKAELHVHLEGSIKPETLLLLAKKNKINLPVKTKSELINFFKFKSFPHFVEIFTLITSSIKTADDYELISYQFGCECARQNIIYAEINISIATGCKLTGLSWQEILNGLNRGRARAQKEFGVNYGWILDILRDEPETQALALEAILNSQDNNIVAIGLSGQENIFKSDKFIKTFEIVNQNKIGTVAHAGEISGPDSIWDVINKIHPNRIGHGVRCIEDPKLVDFIKQKQIPLEICPTSNLCLEIFKDFKSHPLKKLWDAGLFLTINSDDPALFNTDLTNEYKMLVDHFDFEIDDLEKISLNGLRASFLPDDKKQELIGVFKAEFKKLREKIML